LVLVDGGPLRIRRKGRGQAANKKRALSPRSICLSQARRLGALSDLCGQAMSGFITGTFIEI
jgi:hypothetical protein